MRIWGIIVTNKIVYQLHCSDAILRKDWE